jgi:hypothetical protein
VCDGCSSSEDVDIGARMMAMAARETLQIARFSTLDYHAFGVATVQRAATLKTALPLLKSGYLDTTLVIAWVVEGRLTAYMYGDGAILHKSGNSVRAIHVDYQIPMEGELKAAPAYLSYYTDLARKTTYDELNGTKEVYDCLISSSGGLTAVTGTPSVALPFDPVVISAPVAPGDVVAVCSDGIGSFRRADNSQIDWHEMVSEFIGFKSYDGAFVRRRMNTLARRCSKKGLSHADDISVAAIIV